MTWVSDPWIRDATPADAEACAAIYAPYVLETAISFETEPPTTADLGERIAAAQAGHAWLVLGDDTGLRGYAYAGPLKSRAAYRWACEVSVYLRQGSQGRGGGRMLYEALLSRLRERGYRTALACVTLPNEASDRLHRAFGFEPAGTWSRVGWKFETWHDVGFLQLDLEPGAGPPDELR